LTHDGVYAIVRAYGKAALGRPIRPHALRHTAITLALDVARGDVRKVRSFSRHADVRTVMIYDDNRQDHGGKLAEAISALLEV
jgi:integrase/recombinase XerC